MSTVYHHGKLCPYNVNMPEDTRSQPGTLYIELGKRICQGRKELSLNQTELADKIGISQTHLASIENGVRRISLEDLLKTAEVLHCSLEDLLPISDIKLTKKRGPTPKVIKQLERLKNLPEDKQKIVFDLIDSWSNEKS